MNEPRYTLSGKDVECRVLNKEILLGRIFSALDRTM